jgi:hypothetical protein
MAEEGKSNVGLWIGIGCGVLLMLACCGGGVAYYVFKEGMGAFTAPQRHSIGFFEDIRNHGNANALRRMDGVYQSTHDLAAFDQAVASIPALQQHTNASFSSFNIQNDVATVAGSLDTPQGPVPVEVLLVKGGEFWYLSRVTVGGQVLP